MSKYLDVLRHLASLYLDAKTIDNIEDDDGTYEYYVPTAMMRQYSHPKEVTVIYNDYDLTDPDNYVFVFKFEDKMYGFYYFDNSDSMPEVVEDSFKEMVVKEKVVTVYE